MKRLHLTFVFLLLSFIFLSKVLAQVPQGFNYQAVVRDDAGSIVSDQVVGIKVSILQGSVSGTVIYSETHTPTTNAFGLVALEIGGGTTIDDFSAIDWGADLYFLKIEMDASGGTSYSEMGTTQLLSVPYAMFAENVADKDDTDADPANELNTGATLAGNTLQITDAGGTLNVDLGSLEDDADPDPGNELQNLSLTDDILSLTNSLAAVDLSGYLDNTNYWNENDESISYMGNVGIGTATPQGRLEVQGDGLEVPDEPLFEVKRQDGQTVFAVYPEGVRIYVEESEAKGTKGGFAIGGFNPALKGITNEYLRVSPDSVRVYINDETLKGTKGGFAIGGYTPSKGMTREFLRVTDDSTRVYVDNEVVKGTKGGFAVGGYSPGKGTAADFLQMTKENYFIGHESGISITTGNGNLFLGYQSGKNNSTGSSNAFFGYQSGFSNTSGNQNLFLGLASGYTNTTGNNNTFAGIHAGRFNTTGASNTFIGSYSGAANTDGSNNAFIGYESGYSNTSGQGNTFIGNYSGHSNNTGNYNSFVGYQAGYNTNSSYNSFMGYRTGFTNTTGMYNLFMGYEAGYSNTSANSNLLMGYQAGRSTNTGSWNVMLGHEAGFLNTNGTSNVFIGYQTGYNTSSSYDNVFIGHRAGRSHYANNENVYIGSYAGELDSLGHHGVFIGYHAGQNNKLGFGNVFVGDGAGMANQNGNENVYIGRVAGAFNVDGSNNVFIGRYAGRSEAGSNKLYIENSDVGPTAALIYGDFATNFLRLNADVLVPGYLRVDGEIRQGASDYGGYEIQTGGQIYTNDYLVAMGGIHVGNTADPGTDNLHVEGRAGMGGAPAGNSRVKIYDNTANIGALRVESTYSAGTHYGGAFIATTGPSGIGCWAEGSSADFYAAGPGTNYAASSSIRWKSEVEPMKNVLEKIKQLDGVYFTWDEEHGGIRDLGFIGEEVARFFPEITTKDASDPEYILGVDYGKMTPILLQAIKEQQEQIEQLRKQNNELAELKLVVKQLQEQLGLLTKNR